jgi:hypothetical protein
VAGENRRTFGGKFRPSKITLFSVVISIEASKNYVATEITLSLVSTACT